MDQLDLIDTYRAFHPKTTHFTFFSSAYGTLFRTNHILHHKSSLGKFLKSEIISSIFYDHNSIRLHINYRKKKTIKNTNKWRLNNMLLNNQQTTAEIKKETKICLEINDNENTTSKIYGMQ